MQRFVAQCHVSVQLSPTVEEKKVSVLHVLLVQVLQTSRQTRHISESNIMIFLAETVKTFHNIASNCLTVLRNLDN